MRGPRTFRARQVGENILTERAAGVFDSEVPAAALEWMYTVLEHPNLFMEPEIGHKSTNSGYLLIRTLSAKVRTL